MIIVAKEQNADFSSISAALKWVREQYRQNRENWSGETVVVQNGVYEERVEVTVPLVTIVGQDPEKTVISGGLYALMYSEDIGKLGTFRTYTMMVDANDVTLKNLTIENTAGFGPEIGQAIALFAEGDRILVENCRLLGYQDTLYTGPLPPQEMEKNGFIGPKQYSPRINGRQCYRNCYIEGSVDFIFGSATAYFENCTIFQKNIGQEINSYMSAASTAEGEAYGYVFDHCRIIGDAPAETCYLGRPWRNFAQTVILNSYLGPQLRKEGWHNWGKTEAEKTVLYAEYQNEGPGAWNSERPGWVRKLTEEEAALFTRKRVCGGADGWMSEEPVTLL